MSSEVTVYKFIREQDVSGISGTGYVADVVEFEDGTCVMHWNTNPSSTAHYDSVNDLMKIHSHDGRAKLQAVK